MGVPAVLLVLLRRRRMKIVKSYLAMNAWHMYACANAAHKPRQTPLVGRGDHIPCQHPWVGSWSPPTSSDVLGWLSSPLGWFVEPTNLVHTPFKWFVETTFLVNTPGLVRGDHGPCQHPWVGSWSPPTSSDALGWFVVPTYLVSTPGLVRGDRHLVSTPGLVRGDPHLVCTTGLVRGAHKTRQSPLFLCQHPWVGSWRPLTSSYALGWFVETSFLTTPGLVRGAHQPRQSPLFLCPHPWVGSWRPPTSSHALGWFVETTLLVFAPGWFVETTHLVITPLVGSWRPLTSSSRPGLVRGARQPRLRPLVGSWRPPTSTRPGLVRGDHQPRPHALGLLRGDHKDFVLRILTDPTNLVGSGRNRSDVSFLTNRPHHCATLPRYKKPRAQWLA